MKLNVKNLLFSFSGRIPRSAFWITLCILFPLGILVGFIPYQSDVEGIPQILLWIIFVGYSILSIWIALAVYAKRWHDCSKSGWMTLILLIPIIGFFWFVGYLGFVHGTKGSNQYGNDPLDIQAA
ncbi:MAG: hypothetical protein A2V66_09655 [Ignavibacteria bacterium RBG_13_36_8]|nr:MAG: hypothetical protein A2V66_09655 [Ignavibacteria bacterium RBG_13_36_8]